MSQYPPPPQPPQRGFATVSMADFEAQAPARVSWHELRVERREVPLPRQPQAVPRTGR
jgi:hypothetical protein